MFAFWCHTIFIFYLFLFGRLDQDFGGKIGQQAPVMGFWSAREQSPCSVRLASKNTRRDASPASIHYQRTLPSATPGQEHERWLPTTPATGQNKQRQITSGQQRSAADERILSGGKSGRAHTTLQRENSSRSGGAKTTSTQATKAATLERQRSRDERLATSKSTPLRIQTAASSSLAGSRTSLSRRASQERLIGGGAGLRGGQSEVVGEITRAAGRGSLNRVRSSGSFGRKDAENSDLDRNRDQMNRCVFLG